MHTFRDRYTQALDLVLSHSQPLIVCTIYNPKFYDSNLQKLAEAGLSFFNDVIAEEAIRRHLPIIDLREVCAKPEAFANDIEPSELGGELIADAILFEVIPELPRLIIRLDDGEELIFEKSHLGDRQDVYNRKKVAEIRLKMKGSPYGPARYYQSQMDSDYKTEDFYEHDQAANWILDMLGLGAFR